jgi:hypothetical protein
MYFNDTPSLSYSIKGPEGYEVKLFSYQTFGCSHPYTEMIFKVHEDGDVEKIHEVKAFEDPKESGICVD